MFWNEPPKSFTFCHKDTLSDDLELFLGPDPEKDTTFIKFDENFTMADIAVATGKFPSITQARKNGWNGDIPIGFTEKTIGKTQRKSIYGFSNRLINMKEDIKCNS